MGNMGSKSKIKNKPKPDNSDMPILFLERSDVRGLWCFVF
jgi:hypothetical protein